MNTEIDVPTGTDAAARVEAFILSYQPQLLSPGQRAVMLTDIKAAVMATAQPSTIAAGKMMASLCRFIADVAPRAGCPLADVLTEVQLARWTSERKEVWGEGRTLSTHVGRIRQVLRRESGLPARILPERRRRVGAPPLSGEQYGTLRELCMGASAPVARAFAAVFGAGRPGHSAAGGRFVEQDGAVLLIAEDGERRRVLDEAVSPGVVGSVVDPADWEALVDFAALRMRLRVDPAVVYQTFRDRVFALDAPTWWLCRVFRIGSEALDQFLDFVEPVDISSDAKAQAVLRGAA